MLKSMHDAFLHCAVTGLKVAAVCAAIQTRAATYTWDASGSTPPDDGGGTWNATGGTNWYDGSAYGAWDNATTTNEAVFGVGSGAAGTITVGAGGVAASKLTFNAPGSGNYTLSGGTITLDGTAPTIDGAADATIGSIIAGTNGLTKSGANKITLSGNNTISGVVNVKAGTLAVAAGGKASGSTRVQGGTLAINGGAVNWYDYYTSGTINFTSGSCYVNYLLTEAVWTWNQSGGTATFNPNQQENIGFAAGSTARITVSGGTFTHAGVGKNFYLGINGNATLTITNTGAATFNSLYMGYSPSTSTVNLDGGTLTLSALGTGSSSKTINFNGGTLKAGASISIPSSVSTVVKSGGAVFETTAGKTNLVYSALTAGTGGGGLTLKSGRLDLYGNNTYSGATSVSGDLYVRHNNALGTTGANAAAQGTTVKSGGRILFEGNFTVGSELLTIETGNVYALQNLGTYTNEWQGNITGSGTGNANFYANGGRLTLSGTLSANAMRPSFYGAGDFVVSGGISGSGGLYTGTSGTLTLSGANTYAGATTVTNGVLKLAANNALSSNSSVALAGGTLDVSSCTNSAVSLSLTAGSTLALGTNGQVAFTAQTAGAWNGQLTLTGTLGPTSLRFQPALTADQLARIRYDGKSVIQNSAGYIVQLKGTLIRVM